jgi:hypothetical protein
MHQYAQTSNDAYPTLPRPMNITGTDDTNKPFFRLSTTAGVEDAPQTDPKAVDPTYPKPVSANLWLLCRSQFAVPSDFLCPSQPRKGGIDIRDLMEVGTIKRGLRYFSDFPTHPTAGPMISYSFQMPWSNNWNSISPPPGFILAGDENNGSDVQMGLDTSTGNWASALGNTDATKKKVIQAANSTNHKSEGQNLMDSTGAVSFKLNVHSGLNQDNIYTSGLSSMNPSTGSIPQNPASDWGKLDVRPIDVGAPSASVPDTVLVPIMSSVLSANAAKKWAVATK